MMLDKFGEYRARNLRAFRISPDPPESYNISVCLFFYPSFLRVAIILELIVYDSIYGFAAKSQAQAVH